MQQHVTVDEDWLTQALRTQASSTGIPGSVDRFRALLAGWAQGFAELRTDVLSGAMAERRRGVLPAEASSFLRAAGQPVGSGPCTVIRSS